VFLQNRSFGYKAQILTYDDASKKLKAAFTVASDMQSGEWGIRFISLKDKAGNQKFYHSSDFGQEYKVNIKSVFQGTENK